MMAHTLDEDDRTELEAGSQQEHMPGRLLRIAVLSAALVALVGVRAHAQCHCRDVSGCGNAKACENKVVGDACSPPRNATCKAFMHDKSDAGSCCCGCSRGDFPIDCDFDMLTVDPATIPTCGSAALAKDNRRRLLRVDRLLKAAAAKCRKGKPSAATVKAIQAVLAALEKTATKDLGAQGKILRTDDGGYAAPAFRAVETGSESNCAAAR